MQTTFIVHVEDQPGVLTRVASLIRRRGFNIASLTVGRTERDGVSRMTIVMDSDAHAVPRIEANLYKLVNVLSVEDITDKQAVIRDLALIKVRVLPERRTEVLQLVEVFRARAVDVAPQSLTVEITGSQDKISGLLAALSPFGILEMVQSGTVAMTRGEEGDAARSARQSTVRSVSAA